MNKKEKIGIRILIAMSLLFFGIFLLISDLSIKEESPSSNRQDLLDKQVLPVFSLPVVKENSKITETATLEINGIKYESNVEGEISVYEFMNKLQNEGEISFKEKTYIGMGKLIEEINGLKNSGEKNWIYYVNGKKAQIGISNYKINPGDVVSWKYEEDIN